MKNTWRGTWNFLQSRYGIVILGMAVLFGAFNDIVRGIIWIYTLFLLMGIGIAIWLISPNNRFEIVPAIAPIIGYASISIMGSWLVVLDWPVLLWANSLTIILVATNVVLLALWVKNNLTRVRQLDWQLACNNISLGYFAVGLVILPVAIGDMKFSVFRINPYDAQNYMAVAYFLENTPFSRRFDIEMLLGVNPALYLANFLLHFRWATSMLMAYTSILAQIPLFRFDFAFSAFPFTLLLAPVYKIFKNTNLGNWQAFMLAAAITAGYYAQVALDSRAVSFCTSLPIALSLIFLIARIWDDSTNSFMGMPAFIGEIILVVLFVTALITLYPELLFVLAPGAMVCGLIYSIHRVIQFKKVILIAISGALAFLIIYITLPMYLDFIRGQFNVSTDLYVTWHEAYFSWIFHDFPIGIWGLNPYQINGFLSFILLGYASILCLMLIGAVGVLLTRLSSIKNTIAQLSGCIAIGGAIVFAYLYMNEQYWQAGKAFTYSYPFFMIFAAFIPASLKEIPPSKFSPALNNLIQRLTQTWLILMVGTCIYRFFIVSYGMEYPFYLRPSGHTPETYPATYNWEIQQFRDIVTEQRGPVVWLSTDSAFQDMIWDLSMPFDAKVFNVFPVIGYGNLQVTEFNLANLSNNLPDYLIVSNSIWLWNNEPSSLQPFLQDQKFALIKLSRQLPNAPLLIGIRNDLFKLDTSHKKYWVEGMDKGWLVFLSPGECLATLTARSVISDGPPDIMLTTNALPANQTTEVMAKDREQIQIPIPLKQGYNFATIQIKESEGISPFATSITFSSLKIMYTCAQR